MRLTKLFMLAAALALFALPGVAQAKDRDADNLPDRWEKRHHLSTTVKSASADPDGDRVDNRNEYVEGTQPRDRDSDDDGRADGREDRDRDRLSNAAEDATGNDPTDTDTDGDGILDGQEQAGVVSAYDEETGALTIDLANGGSVTAAVTEDTDVDCATEAVAEAPADGEADASASRRGEGFGCDGGRDSGEDEECPDGTLAVGARIHEAALRVTSRGSEWTEIEVITSAAS